jgi:hypothetical protein
MDLEQEIKTTSELKRKITLANQERADLIVKNAKIPWRICSLAWLIVSATFVYDRNILTQALSVSSRSSTIVNGLVHSAFPEDVHLQGLNKEISY